MGMTYIIGYNKSQPLEMQPSEFSCNSYVHALLKYLMVEALMANYHNLYDDITVDEGLHLIQFDELNQQDFMTVITAIRNFIKNGDELIADNAEIWNLDIEPLIVIDDRYDPNLVLLY